MTDIINDTGLENLCNAIVKQAAEDYAAAYMGWEVDKKSPPDTIRECEEFFRSDWYKELTQVDGDFPMKQLKIRELEKAINAFTTALDPTRTVTLTLRVNKTKTKEKIKYVIPPRLFAMLETVLRTEIEDLNMELKEVKEHD